MEFLATKGLEYLLVIGYLLLFIPFWMLLQRGRSAEVEAHAPGAHVRDAARDRWFEIPDDRLFHRGHAWALPQGEGVFAVGVDDFTGKLLGRPDALKLPVAGQTVEAGSKGWAMEIDGSLLGMLSPVTGRVLDVNPDALRDPGLVADDPYGRGWLLKVKVPKDDTTVKNLLPAALARTGTDEAADRLLRAASPELGTVLQDGGVPVLGIAREVSPDGWKRLASELLLTS
jgi:glycine cleavage system H lipoate-binding protein